MHIFAFVAAFTFLFLFLFKLLRRKTTNLPPSPAALPILGNLHQVGRLPHRSLASLSEKYGPLFLVRLGSIPVAVVSSVDIAEEVLKTQDLTFASRPPSSMASRLLYGPRDVIYSPYGPYWRQMRKICVIHLLSLKRVQEIQPILKEEVAILLSEIAGASPAPVNLSEMVEDLSKDIICRAALGRKCSGGRRFGEMVKELMDLFGSFPMRDFIPWLGWVDEISGLNARVRRSFIEFDRFLEGVLEEHDIRRRESEEGNGISGVGVDRQSVDFVDVLLSLKEKDDDGLTFTLHRDSIKAILMDMFVAGTETSSTTIEWAMTELLRHPNLMKKTQEEIRRIVGSNSIVDEEEDIEQMEYFKAVVKETLRLHPPVSILIPRAARKDTNLQGYQIPAGTTVFVNAWKIARDPAYWEEPDEFWPDRFLEKDVDHCTGQDFHYLPFGSGRRSCPGASFGLISVHYILANLLHFFNWEIPEERKKEAFDMSELAGVARKKLGLVLSASPYILN
ncbi:Cytochrome P450 71A25 [Apostasia shenzhenica]|uniref:Cytochrome P450 71A25 n=1 Tax=Apostasia shenzhenica TaxID=1088818 RepID=A0A2I0B6A6_9ASPA|nr:Cytochrome P450 71A25 [Apostasia shenzhenica]